MREMINHTAEPDDRLPLAEAAAGLPGPKDGTGIGDIVDPATVELWTADYLKSRGDAADAHTLAAAFQFGVRAESRYAGQSFVEAEPQLRSEWSSERGRLPWDGMRDAIWAGFDRARSRRV